MTQNTLVQPVTSQTEGTASKKLKRKDSRKTYEIAGHSSIDPNKTEMLQQEQGSCL